MIGSGVFLLPASLAAYRGTSLLGWGVSTLGSVSLAVVFARLARTHPLAGGPYAYTREAFGDVAGFLVAWGYWISCWCTNAALAVAFVGYLDPFVPALVRSPLAAALIAISTLWTLTLVNLLGVKTVGRVQVVTTILKLVPLVVVGVGGLLWFEPSRFAIPPPGTTSLGADTLAVVTLTLWAFLGLEAATIPAAVVRDPARTIPRATIVGTLVAAAIYIVSTIGVMSVVAPEALTSSTAPFADAARHMGGETLARFVAIGAALSCIGALNGWILVAGQLPLAIADDGLFPAVFAARDAGGAPRRATLISAALSTALIGMNYTESLVTLFTRIILLATLSTLVPYVFCSLAVLLRSRGTRPRAGGLIGGVAFVYSMVAVVGAGRDVVLLGSLLLLAGLPVFAWMKWTSRDAVTS